MANLSVTIGANTSKFVSEMNNAKSMLDKFVSGTDAASASARENMGVTQEQAQAYRNFIEALQKVGDGSMTLKQQQKALRDQIADLKNQWSELSNTAMASDFGQSMSDTMRAAKEQLDSIKNSISQVDNVKPQNLKKELRMTTNELVQLTAKYRAMSDAEKQSAGGQEMARKMDELRAKAGTLSDTIGDVNQEIKVMASDTPNLDVFNQVLGIGADALSTYSSVIARVTGDEKSLQNAISTVLAVQSAANLATKVANALQSSSALMLKVRQIQENAATTAIALRTAAEGKGTIATKSATAAQAAFNLVAKANPYVLIATAAIAAVGAIYAYSAATSDAKEKDEDLTNSFKSQYSQLADNIVQIKQLQTQWNALKSDAEKKKWIDDNKDAFHNLGVEVNSVDDAENLLVRNTSKFINVLKLRAQAAAYAAYAQTQYQKALEGKDDVENVDPEWYEKAFTQLSQFAQGKYVQTFEEIKRSAQRDAYDATLDAELKAEEALKKSEELNRKSEELANQNNIKTASTAKSTQSSAKSTQSSTKKINEDLEAAKGSLDDLEHQLSKLQSDYKKGLLVGVDPASYRKMERELQKKIRDKEVELGLEPKIEEGSLAHIEQQITEKEYDLKFEVDQASRNKLAAEIEELTKQKRIIELGMKPVTTGFVVKDGELEDIITSLNSEWKKYMSQKYDLMQFPPDPTSGLTKWRKKAENILRGISFYSPEINLKTNNPYGDTGNSVADMLEYYRTAVDKLSTAYDNYIKKLRDTDILTNEEIDIIREYIDRKAEMMAMTETKQELSNKPELSEEDKAFLEYYDSQLNALRNVEAAYKNLEETKAGFTHVTNDDIKAVYVYRQSAATIAELEEEYKKASEAAYEFNRKAMISESRWEIFRTGIDAVGGLTNALHSNAKAWAEISGKELSKGFEDTVSVIDAVINSLNLLISTYDSVNKIIKLFGEISELSAAKKVAADQAQMASSQTLQAQENANTLQKVANDQTETTSTMGALGVKQADAIANATKSGSALPFPANIAAIAAGIAAVVSAFALVFSAFEQGGIVGGGTYNGDTQLVRVNSGEMILNGTEQRRLFNLLNGSGSRNGTTIGEGGVVKFKLKGKNLYGSLNNLSKQRRRI